MQKKSKFIILSSLLISFVASSLSYAQEKTTVIEETTTQTVPKSKKAKPVVKTSTVVTTTEHQPRQVIDEETLKKMSNTICTEGFKSYVGVDKKNVCQGKATSPDLAYSCVWNKKGTAAYPPTPQGPCTLDFAEHRGSVIITKDDYASSPPLAYGTEAYCCFRAAK